MKHAVYDFSVSPYSYDFVQFLMCASDEGAENVVIVPGKREWSKLTVDQELSRLHNLILPLARCWGSYELVSGREQARGLDVVWPPRYSADKPTPGHQLAYAALARDFKPLQASPEAMVWAEQYRGALVVTIRQSAYNPARDSNVNAWLAFGLFALKSGERVIFVADNDAPRNFAMFETLNGLSVDKRIALYDVAKLNLGVNNGPLSLCVYSKRPLLIFKFCVEADRASSADFLTRQGFPPGAQYLWFEKHQHIIWEDDTAENLWAGFEKWKAVQEGRDTWGPMTIPALRLKGASNPQARQQSVEYALSKPFDRLREAPAHGGTMSIVCFGPSLQYTWQDVQRPFMTVSGAHDFMIERGMVPDFHVECDPREHKARFLEHPHREVRYLVASCCHPKMLDQLERQNVKLWHAEDGDAFFEWLKTHDPESLVVGGGSNAGLKALEMAGALGFRKFDVFGMDCSFTPDATHAGVHFGKKQARMRVRCGEREFITSVPMLQGARDFLLLTGIETQLHGDGLLQAMAEQAMKVEA